MPEDSPSAAVLFADVVGSMELYRQLGDSRARAEIRRFLDELSTEAQRHAGRVVKVIGDEMMCAFGTADTACEAACAMQHRAERAAGSYAASFALRIGFHWGRVIEEAGDLFGDTVNLAARVAALATQDRILTTEPTYIALSEQIKRNVIRRGFAAVKGVEEGLQLCEVVWREERTVLASADKLRLLTASAESCSRLRLQCRGQQLLLEVGRQPISIGRNATNVLVIPDPYVSGNHARIERRGGQFVLCESSSNGTYVAFEGETFFRVPRTLTLRRSGRMAIGREPSDPDVVIVEFRCE